MNIPVKAKPGVFIKILIKDGIFTYGQMLENGHLAIFDYFDSGESSINLKTILSSRVIFSPVIFDTVKTRIINKGIWQIVGFKIISEEVINQIKPRFHLNETNSALLFYDGKEIDNVDVNTMYGLFPISVYNEQNILKLLEAYIQDRYSNSEILSMLHVYFAGSIPSDCRIPKVYFTWPRNKPLPKPNELSL